MERREGPIFGEMGFGATIPLEEHEQSDRGGYLNLRGRCESKWFMYGFRGDEDLI